MVLIRCVGHAINVPSATPTVLTSVVGIGTVADASLTFSATTLEKSLCMGTMCMVEPLGYTLSMAITRGEFPSTNNLHQ